jgi:hypothetical protein
MDIWGFFFLYFFLCVQGCEISGQNCTREKSNWYKIGPFLKGWAITVLAFVINLFLYHFFSQTKCHMDKIVSQYGDVVLRKSASILKRYNTVTRKPDLNNRFFCTTGLWHLSGRTVVERHGHRVPHWISRERNHKGRQNTYNKTCHSTSYNTYSRFV